MNNKVKKLINKYEDYINSREIYFNYLEKYNTFSSSLLKHTKNILIEHNTMFEFEKEGNVREGALTQKKLNYKIDNIPMFLKVIKIRKNIDFSSQIHTYFHELSHLVNEHEIKKNNNSLSYSQKEYVAEVCAQALLYSFVGGSKISDLPSNNKWDRSNYIYSWIRNARMSDKKIDEMWKQINFAYNKISDSILKNINN